MNIQSTRITTPRIQPKQAPTADCPCHVDEHDGHGHAGPTSAFHIPEAVVDVSHAALDVYALSGGGEGIVGGASAAISVLAAARGFQSFKSGGLEHSVEGVGNLALSVASGLTAFESFTESHGGHDHHGHGFGVIGALEAVHGLAEVSVGAMEAKRPDRRTIGLIRMAKGAAVLGSQVFPGAAAGLQLFNLGATCVLAGMDPWH